MSKLGDEAKNAAKNKAKKMATTLLIKLIPIIAAILVVVVIGGGVVSIFTTVKDTMIQLASNIATKVTTVWKDLTDDYWMDIDKEIEYIVNKETGEVLGRADEIDTSEYENQGINIETQEYTLVDRYIKDLSDLGISLKELNLLGDFEFSEEDNKLTERELIDKILTDENYELQKRTIEKYISEFVKADLISQSIHRRRGEDLVKSNDETKIDGGVYLYRTKYNTQNTEGAVEVTEDKYVKTIGEKEYVQMEYVEPSEFMKLANVGTLIEGEQQGNEVNASIKYKYTIDEETGQLIIANTKRVTTLTWKNGGVFEDNTELESKTYLSELKYIDYKQYISGYTMPYEFLINLCEITQNPEYVYHVAMLARETSINLAIQDDTTTETVTIYQENKYESYVNTSNNQTASASLTGEKTENTITVITTITTNPNLRLEYANTWSFYKENEYTIVTEQSSEENGPITEEFEKPATLGNYETIPQYDKETGERLPEDLDRWYDTFLVKTDTKTEVHTVTSTYSVGIEKNAVEKSKQFLGLLRNETGECYSRFCYINHKEALDCAKNAEFVKVEDNGIMVSYRIPNSTRTEKPLSKLLSGEQLLYSMLGEGYEGDDSATAEADYNSLYKEKMQTSLDHMKYLLTFPDNEELEDYIDNIDKPIDEDEYEEINIDDLIVKTDEEGALRAVTEEELIGVINATFTGKEKENALSIANTLVECQNTYNVNAIFVLAFAHQESNIGTANTKWVRQNNWLSWSLGTSYSSPQANVETVMRNIATGNNYFTQGKITIKDIGYTYCPNTNDYPTQGDDWVKNVTSYVKKMYAKLGINIETPDANDNSTTYTVNGHTYKNYKQDSGASWSDNPFAGGTMKKSGCSITSVAIVLTGYGHNVTPEDIRQEVGGQTTDLCSLLNKYGISNSRPGRALTADEIKEHLKTGKPIIVNVKGEWTSSTGHYMVLLDYKNENGIDYVYVSNPGTVNSTKNGWVQLSRISNNMKTRSIFITSD